MNCDKFSVAHRAFLAAITSGREPTTFREAMLDSNWQIAMQEEKNTYVDG